MPTEAVKRAVVSGIRYAQCWEDADILIEALQPGPGKRCLSIASAGDNTLALLARSPAYVLAVDRSSEQLACLELRAAAYRELQYGELLSLLGSNPCGDRMRLYRQCRRRLSGATRTFWDEHSNFVEHGIGNAGKFETYFRVFRTNVLPLIHSRRRIFELLLPKSREERIEFYQRVWDCRRWRAMFCIFFSRQVMSALGRDREFFRYVDGDVAGRILARTRYALTELDPAANPYVRWILTGQHNGVLPFALREENFEPIRRNIDRIEWRHAAMDEVKHTDAPFDCFNLSDIFEYMSPPHYVQQLKSIVLLARPGARLAYWNMLAPRRCPPKLADSLDELAELSARLFVQDKAFFYSAFVVEQVR